MAAARGLTYVPVSEGDLRGVPRHEGVAVVVLRLHEHVRLDCEHRWEVVSDTVERLTGSLG